MLFELPRSIYRPSKKHAMQLHMSIESRNRCTKDEDITVFYNWLRRILSSTANASTYNMILRELLLSIILLSFIFALIDVFAQHMMMPPDASVGNRKIMLSLQAEPANIISSQKVMTKLAFIDENTKQTVQHITVRMDVSLTAKMGDISSQNTFTPTTEKSILISDQTG